MLPTINQELSTDEQRGILQSPGTKRIVDCALEYHDVFALGEDDRGEVAEVEHQIETADHREGSTSPVEELMSAQQDDPELALKIKYLEDGTLLMKPLQNDWLQRNEAMWYLMVSSTWSM